MGCGFQMAGRGESICIFAFGQKLRCGSVEPPPAALVRAAFNWFDSPYSALPNKKRTLRGCVSYLVEHPQLEGNT